jgi:replicative DNA helicase
MVRGRRACGLCGGVYPAYDSVGKKEKDAIMAEEIQAIRDIKQLPNNYDAEKSLLGCFLIDKYVADSVIEGLDKEIFYNDINRSVFSAMLSIKKKGGNIDLVTVNDLLERTQKANENTLEYLTSLADNLVSSALYSEYIHILRRDYTLRRLIASCNEIIKQAYSSPDADSVLQTAEKLIYEIGKSHTKKDLEHIEKASSALMNKLSEMVKDKFAYRGLQTGFKIVDRMTNGLQRGDLIILAARPSVGKTTLALNFVANIIKSEAKKNIAIFSLEMPAIQLAQRIISNIGGIEMEAISKGEIMQEGMGKLWKAHQKITESQVYIDDGSMVKAGEILAKCRRLASVVGGLDLIIVDYLQLMTGERKKQNETQEQEISDISRMMKVIARELDVPVIAISQMSRGIENRKDKSPKLSDLRASGAIEQDADIVAFLTREDEDDKTSPVILNVEKHRNGALFAVRFNWHGEFVRFEESMDQVIKSAD